jgi:hypothetical protein
MNAFVNYEIFDGFHVVYIVLSLAITAMALILPHKYIKTQKGKDTYLKVWGVVTPFLHISMLWTEFLKNGAATVSDNMLFPIYFCNLTMYLLIVVSFMSNKESKWFNYLAVVTSYGGILGALISLFYPDYYVNEATALTWPIWKSLLSHSTMLIGCLYLITGKYIEIKRRNIWVFGLGLLGSGVVGALLILTYKLAGLTLPNAMYLLKPALETDNKLEAVLLSGYAIAIYMVLVTTVVTIAYEKIIAYNKTKKPKHLAPIK